jgi:iron complex transport system substrate-binding protein
MLAVLLAAPAGAAGPRLVSINPCVDAILWRVADPDQLLAVSSYSQRADATSVPLAWARQFPATGGTAEEVAALGPAQVLAGAHTAPATVAALARLQLPLAEFGVPASVAESEAQVRAIARLAGHPARGEALVAAMEAALAGARAPAGPLVPALIWEGEGLVPGAGTLADDLLARTGFANQSARYGLRQWDVLPLEYLVARPPRVVFSAAAADGTGDRMTRHPALARLRRFATIEPFPERLLRCGGPTVIDAARRLGAARRALR